MLPHVARFLQDPIGKSFPTLREQIIKRCSLAGIFRRASSLLQVGNRLPKAIHLGQQSAQIPNRFEIFRIERNRKKKLAQCLLTPTASQLRGADVVRELRGWRLQ